MAFYILCVEKKKKKNGCLLSHCTTDSFITDLVGVSVCLSVLFKKERVSETVNNVVLRDVSVLAGDCTE